MKKNLEEMQVKVANKRAILESHDGEEFSPITVAKNVLCEDGTTMQDYFDNHSEPNISTKIVNSNSMSKVGQGDNVDFSDNVMDGAYEDVVLKGKSLVNVLSYTKVGGNVPLVKNGNIIEVETISENTWRSVDVAFVYIKPNTKYIITWDDISFSNTNFVPTSSLISVRLKTDNTQIAGWDSSRNYIIATVPSNTNDVCLRVHASQGTAIINKTTVKGLKVLEYIEGMENWGIPYFEGICDVKSPIVKNVGKNLFDNVFVQGGWWNGVADDNAKEFMRSVNLTPVKPNTTYAYDSTVKGHRQNANFMAHDINGDFIKYLGFGRTFTAPSNCHYIHLYTENDDSLYAQIEEGVVSTTIEPYKSNTTTFTSNDDEIIVLRSLPNGTCDTLNVETGEYVQSVGEIVLDGSDDEGWVLNANGDFYRYSSTIISGQFIGPELQSTIPKNLLCDQYKSISFGNTWDNSDFGIALYYNSTLVVCDGTSDLNNFKTRLQANPVTVQYELATPIVKQVNVESYPYAYENGHVLLESGSIEQSLTPTIEYSIVANRGGQIRSNQRTVERHQKKLDSLYAMTLVNMIDSQYKQVLMKLKSELGSEVISWDI